MENPSSATDVAKHVNKSTVRKVVEEAQLYIIFIKLYQGQVSIRRPHRLREAGGWRQWPELGQMRQVQRQDLRRRKDGQ